MMRTQMKLIQRSAFFVSAAILTACSTSQSSLPPVANWGEVQIAETIDRLELYARPDGFVLSARDETAVAAFLQEYGRYGDGPLYLNVPNSQVYAGGVQQAHYEVARILSNIGLSGAPIEMGQYQVGFAEPAPVVVSYRRLKTIPQDCRSLGNITASGRNRAYDGFGCSFHANLAAMVEDPRQFLEPNPVMPPDMQRRMQVYDAYIEGENPASEQPERQEVSAGSDDN